MKFPEYVEFESASVSTRYISVPPGMSTGSQVNELSDMFEKVRHNVAVKSKSFKVKLGQFPLQRNVKDLLYIGSG